jgi:hypothetical protein
MLKIIILLVVLYEFEIQSLTLKEEHRIRIFENRFPKGSICIKYGVNVEYSDAGENCIIMNSSILLFARYRCGRKNYPILEAKKNQTKQDTFFKS